MNKNKTKNKKLIKNRKKLANKNKTSNRKVDLDKPTKNDCQCENTTCGCRQVDKFSQNGVPRLITSTDQVQQNLVMRNTMPLISRLFKPITNRIEESKYLYPSSYGGPPGPACNWRKCSNKGGCGTECVCHPAGQYGWRCIPKCCIGRGGYPPCRQVYGYDVMCTLPCSTWPGLCQENFWNPYHTYQGPYAYPSGQPNLKPLYG